jgi:hypothetical protein
MGKSANPKVIEVLRRYYRKLLEDHTNDEIAAKLRIDPAYLSRIGTGAINKKTGKPYKPGPKFIKTFYMTYPEFNQSTEGKENESNANQNNDDIKKKVPPYDHEGIPYDPLREAQMLYMTRTDQLLEHYKTIEELTQNRLTKLMVDHGTLINTHDKVVDLNIGLTKKALNI